MVRVFTNGPRHLGSILGLVIPTTKKMVLGIFLFNTQHYKARIKGKLSNIGKEVAPSSTFQWSSHWKGRHRLALIYGRPPN